MYSIPERDWKKLSANRKAALQRQCQKALNELVDLIQTQSAHQSAHDTYLEVYQKVRNDDKIIARDFNDWRRSTAYAHLVAWVEAGVLTREEYLSLSEETRQRLEVWHEVRFFDPGAKLI